tara:strand:+ start:249 stop:527 length:279 start_codon:yes stop_codon:yes gene_type:complete
MSDVNINKSLENMNEPSIEDLEDGEIVFGDGAFNGFEGQSITINETAATQGDLQAGIEFIYHMREHLVDIGVATIYLFSCYALYLWLKKVIK